MLYRFYRYHAVTARTIDECAINRARILWRRGRIGIPGSWFAPSEIQSRVNRAKKSIFLIECECADGHTTHLSTSELRRFYALNQIGGC